MKKILPILFFSLFSCLGFGQLAEFNFTTSPFLNVTTSDLHVTVSDMGISSGSIGTDINFGNYFPNEPYIQGTGGYTASSQATAKEFCFDMTVEAGFEMEITNVFFRNYATSAGPSVIGFSIGSTLYAETNIPSGGSTTNINQAISDQSGLTGTVSICIQGWDNNSRSTSGGGNHRMDDVIISGTTTPLAAPITLSNFTAAPEDKNVSLNWTTASEENNDYFSIEHSTDGITYTEIDYVKGAGTSYVENNYEYTHRTPAKGSNYYRLMQVDYNRNTSYSPVEVVEFAGEDLFTIRPTLAKGEVILTFEEDLSRNATIEVFDLVGRRVLSEQIAGNESNFTFDASNFQNGHYLVRMQAAGQVHSARFVKY